MKHLFDGKIQTNKTLSSGHTFNLYSWFKEKKEIFHESNHFYTVFLNNNNNVQYIRYWFIHLIWTQWYPFLSMKTKHTVSIFIYFQTQTLTHTETHLYFSAAISLKQMKNKCSTWDIYLNKFTIYMESVCSCVEKKMMSSTEFEFQLQF